MLHVNAAMGCDPDGLHSHAGHLCAGGVGSMRAHGDEADLPVDIAAGLVVTLDGTQPGVLSLGTAGKRYIFFYYIKIIEYLQQANMNSERAWKEERLLHSKK